MHSRAPERTKQRRPDLDTFYTVNADGSRNSIHPADVHGRWQRRKNVIWTLLIALYVVLPWIPIGGRPALLIDLRSRSAFVFGATFTNQDFYLVFFLISGFGFALFVVTSLWGRIWCGYACPQSVFMEGVFRKIERWIEGERNERIRRNLGAWNWDKAWRKTLKLGIFLGLSFAIAHVFLAYFIPVRELLGLMTRAPGEHSADFIWVMAWTGVLFFDFAWFREQTCLIVCPYGRTQSAFVDRDTIVIGYDQKRGEPRGRKGEAQGDCIDCFRCVAVCPTGIDIRHGQQMECIGCANCVDACDEIMAKLDRAPGLIRYDSQRSFSGEKSRSLLRPRVVLYTFLGLLGIAVFGQTALGRSTFEAKVLRARGLPYIIEGDIIRNVFTIHLQNKSSRDATYTIHAVPADSLIVPEIVIAQPTVHLATLGDEEVPVIATAHQGATTARIPIRIAVSDSASGETRIVELAFRAPGG
jgi:cytochrome c oxidase accessory protein FixG